MTAAQQTTTGALRLLVEILQTYSSLEEFLDHLRRATDAPTEQLPRIDLPAVSVRYPGVSVPGDGGPGMGRHMLRPDVVG